MQLRVSSGGGGSLRGGGGGGGGGSESDSYIRTPTLETVFTHTHTHTYTPICHGGVGVSDEEILENAAFLARKPVPARREDSVCHEC